METGRTRTDAFRVRLKALRTRQGLSQLALANRASLSQKHVSFLETGRSRPGRAMVLRLADALDLSPLERDTLLETAGFTAVPVEIGSWNEDYAAIDRAVSRTMALHEPFPAVLLDRAQTVLRTNTSFDRVIGLASPDGEIWTRTCGDGPRNLLRLTLHAQGLFPFIVDPVRFVPSYLDRVLREAGGDPETRDLVDEVLAWPQISALGAARLADLPSRLPPVMDEHFRMGDTEIRLICLVMTIGAPQSPLAERLRLEVSHPADDQTEALLRAL